MTYVAICPLMFYVDHRTLLYRDSLFYFGGIFGRSMQPPPFSLRVDSFPSARGKMIGMICSHSYLIENDTDTLHAAFEHTDQDPVDDPSY